MGKTNFPPFRFFIRKKIRRQRLYLDKEPKKSTPVQSWGFFVEERKIEAR
jgi:hypothetical protein